MDATTHVLTLVAGTGTPGSLGNGGPATSAQLNTPEGVAVDTLGNLYIADFGNDAVRKVYDLAGSGEVARPRDVVRTAASEIMQ